MNQVSERESKKKINGWNARVLCILHQLLATNILIVRTHSHTHTRTHNRHKHTCTHTRPLKNTQQCICFFHTPALINLVELSIKNLNEPGVWTKALNQKSCCRAHEHTPLNVPSKPELDDSTACFKTLSEFFSMSQSSFVKRLLRNELKNNSVDSELPVRRSLVWRKFLVWQN